MIIRFDDPNTQMPVEIGFRSHDPQSFARGLGVTLMWAMHHDVQVQFTPEDQDPTFETLDLPDPAVN